ncbi:4'-phosphopantetheinyl transferase superfamily protein [Streptomyces sp. NPDC088196]|uniref:4'-phosphopantetheinyl transferase family protein n=1 Tax=Streptomyces sp. NPDC088196 TaxID=3154868 RepID=UPI00344B8831
MYVAAHTALRHLLGACLQLPPDSVPLTRLPCPGCGGPHGRPAARPLDVDVERVPEQRLVRDAARSLHPAEQAELARTAPESRSAAFARCRTRKEAYLKATGEGLSGAALRGAYVGCGRRPSGPPSWRVTDVDVPAGWIAACAVAAD